MTVRAKLREIAEQSAIDPKQALLDSVGDISGYRLLGPRVLVATYLGTDKSPGGIIYADRSLLEGRFQGKVGLVLQLGAGIPEPHLFEVGDWVEIRPSDGIEKFFVDKTRGGTPCRVIEENLIIAVLDNPEMIW